jgi:hypothetical protein
MWQRTAVTLLAIGSVITGVRASDLASAANAQGNLATPDRAYSLKLQRFFPAPNQPAGLLVKVRINGGHPLELLLDSGADLMVVGSRAARAAGITGERVNSLVGLGNRPVRVGQAKTVDIGPVSFRNSRVGFVKGSVVDGADGVVPLSLFSQFRVRLDLRRKRLDLIPYAREPGPAASSLRPGGRHNLLLVPAVLNGERKGYVVLDTGSYCSGISRSAARALNGFPLVSDVPLSTGTGLATGRRVSSLVHFAVAGHDLTPRDVVAMDLSNVSRRYGVEIIGLLGFPALSRYVLTVDYREGWVRMEPPQKLSAPGPQIGDNAKLPVPLAFR